MSQSSSERGELARVEDPERLAEVLRVARAQADALLREEWRARRTECVLGAGGILMIGLILGGCIIPMFGIGGASAVLGVSVPLLIAAVWFWRRWRCPRCDRTPVHLATTRPEQLLRPFALPGCPHCGLRFTQETSEGEIGVEPTSPSP